MKKKVLKNRYKLKEDEIYRKLFGEKRKMQGEINK